MWVLDCPWCDWKAYVWGRGMSGGDMGSGVEAATSGERHAKEVHQRTWKEFLLAKGSLKARRNEI